MIRVDKNGNLNSCIIKIFNFIFVTKFTFSQKYDKSSKINKNHKYGERHVDATHIINSRPRA